MDRSELVNFSGFEFLLDFLYLFELFLILLLLIISILRQLLALFKHLTDSHVLVCLHHADQFVNHVYLFHSERGLIQVNLIFYKIQFFHVIDSSIVVLDELSVKYFFHFLSTNGCLMGCLLGETDRI